MTSLVKRALSSAGRASRLHREGREFEPLSAHQYKPPARAVFFCFWLNRGLNSREGSSTTSERQTRVCQSASPMSAGANKLFIKKRRSARSAHQYKPPERAVFFCFWLNRGLNSREGSSTTSERQTRVCQSASPMSAGANKLFIKKRRSALAPFRLGVNAFAAEKDYYMRKKHTKCIFFVKCL